MINCLPCCNRSHFDFSEGESELVSGFNTEYGGGIFSVIFITEYGSIFSLYYYLFFYWKFYFVFLILFFNYLFIIIKLYIQDD